MVDIEEEIFRYKFSRKKVKDPQVALNRLIRAYKIFDSDNRQWKSPSDKHGSSFYGKTGFINQKEQFCVVKMNYSETKKNHLFFVDKYLQQKDKDEVIEKPELFGNVSYEEYKEIIKNQTSNKKDKKSKKRKESKSKQYKFIKSNRHYKFILSPELNLSKEQLKDFTQIFMRHVERELGRRFNWQAAVHTNTEHNHVHILVNGFDQDGIIDYYWIMPMTFGQVVTTSKKTEATDKVHVGDSKYRAVWNEEQAIPEIYISEKATVEGGKYADGQYIFAYVAGPANYVRVADDGANADIKTMTAKLISNVSDGLVPRFDNGVALPMYWSGVRATGHYIGYDYPGAICGLQSDIDVNPGAFMNSNFRRSMGSSENGGKHNLGRTWEITYAGGDILLAKVVSDGSDNIANNYAYLEYKNEEKGEVTFLAGGINMEAELVYGPHVRAFIDGKYQIVELAENIKVDGETVKQNDEYLIDNIFDATGTRLCTYKVRKADGKELYSFYPLNLEINDTNKISNLANDFDAGLTYATKASGFAFEKLYDNVYRFVPAAGKSSLPSELNVPGLRNVTVDENTTIIVNYTDEAGEKDFVLYGADNLPNFDVKDKDMTLKNAVVVLKNKTTSTSNEILDFLYCEIGGAVVDAVKNAEDYRIVIGKQEVYVEEDDEVVVAYNVVNPYTAETMDGAEVLRPSGNELDIYNLYVVDATTGYIQNTSAGHKADLTKDSEDLVTLEEYEADAEFITVSGGTSISVDDKTVVAFFDRDTLEYTIEDLSLLDADAGVEADEIYFNEGEDKLTLLVLAEDVKNEYLDLAKLIIVVRG